MKLTDPPAMAFESENATRDRDEAGRFLKGIGGRSPGRPKGSRVRLSEKFFAALHDDFEEHGVAAIARVRFHDPSTYFSVIAKLMPQKLEITNPVEEISDELLAIMLALAEQRLAEQRLAESPMIDAVAVNVTPAFAAPTFADAPPTEAAQRAQALRRHLHDQHDALAAVAPVIPALATPLPHPVGRAVPVSAREEERRNIAKLNDDIDPVDPATLF